MRPIPLNSETEKVARRVIWFEPPVETLADPVRFMAYTVSHATHDDMKVIRRYVSDDDFREALDRPPPGIINPRSCVYWNSKFGRFPRRHFRSASFDDWRLAKSVGNAVLPTPIHPRRGLKPPRMPVRPILERPAGRPPGTASTPGPIWSRFGLWGP